MAKLSQKGKELWDALAKVRFDRFDSLRDDYGYLKGYVGVLHDIVEVAIQKKLTNLLTPKDRYGSNNESVINRVIDEDIAGSAWNTLAKYCNAKKVRAGIRTMVTPYFIEPPQNIVLNLPTGTGQSGAPRNPAIRLQWCTTGDKSGDYGNLLLITFQSGYANKFAVLDPAPDPWNFTVTRMFNVMRDQYMSWSPRNPSNGTNEGCYPDVVTVMIHWLDRANEYVTQLLRMQGVMLDLINDSYLLMCEDDDESADTRLDMLNRRAVASLRPLVNRLSELSELDDKYPWNQDMKCYFLEKWNPNINNYQGGNNNLPHHFDGDVSQQCIWRQASNLVNGREFMSYGDVIESMDPAFDQYFEY